MSTQQECVSTPLAGDSERRLQARLEQFDLWATTADKAEDGWESDFPEWLALTHEAEQIMAQEHPSNHALRLLGRCFIFNRAG